MTQNCITVGVLCGGQSPEHRISLLSAMNVILALQQASYHVIPIGIREDGQWCLSDDPLIVDASDEKNVHLNASFKRVTLLPRGGLFDLDKQHVIPECVDVIFPILHGPNGEDGVIQGYLRTLGIPYVGSDQYGCVQTMDKVLTKLKLQQAELPVVPWAVVTRKEWETYSMDTLFKKLSDKLGPKLFLKPTRMGSSIGVSSAETVDAFEAGLKEAFEYDDRILVEQFWQGDELECAVLEGRPGESVRASILGQIKPRDKYYSYASKYQSLGADLIIPAPLGPELQKLLTSAAIAAFDVTDCAHLARVDFFARSEDEWVINEINVLPGFTMISMYPKLWHETGIESDQLVTKLVELALQRG